MSKRINVGKSNDQIEDQENNKTGRSVGDNKEKNMSQVRNPKNKKRDPKKIQALHQ